MKKYIMIILVLFLAGCAQTAHQAHDTHVGHEMETHDGCHPDDLDESGNCELAEDGEQNAELFSEESDVVVEEVTHQTASGLLVTPTAEGNYPGVVMIHEWWGLNDNIEDMAKQLAAEGYRVFAIDLYGEVAEDATNARRLSSAVRENQEEATQKLRDAVAFLREESTTIGSIGWCFGGGQSLNLALSGEEMDATIIYYGHLNYDEESLAQVSWPVLGIFGEEDTGIPVESVEAFDTAMDEIGIENSVHIYPGVGHAFANPSGSRYAPEETKDAWEKTLIFLDESLKQDTPQELSEPSEAFGEGEYVLAAQSSTLTYEASKIVAKPHIGTVALKSGELQNKGGSWSGNFVIDMNEITDSSDSERYLAHIKNEDFFNVEQYPESTITITDVTGADGDFTVTGDLTILDATHEITFPAQATLEDGMMQVTASFEIDRTKWGITYGSGSVFDDLGDKAIKDEIKFDLDLLFIVS